MLLRSWLTAWLPLVLLLLCAAPQSVCGAKKKDKAPKTSVTYQDHSPSRVVYFDDSSSVLYHDGTGKNVYRSSDEGASWTQVDGIPAGSALAVIEHPYDLSTAFVLTKSKTHYRSTNRGQSWQSFDTDLPPTSGSTSLEFHSSNWDSILYIGKKCESDVWSWLGGQTCWDVAYYTTDAFASKPKKLLDYVHKCAWAHSKKEFDRDAAQDTVLCVAFGSPRDSSSGSNSSPPPATLRESRLYASTDFFQSDHTLVDFGIGEKQARGVVGLGTVQSFLVAALKPTSEDHPSGTTDDMVLYVSRDAKHWQRGIFPHGQGLKEHAYTLTEGSPWSLFADVLTDPDAQSGTMFTSNSDGTYFIKSLENTNRNMAGIVDFEKLENVEGVAIANILANPDEVRQGPFSTDRQLQTRITFDDGSKWHLLAPPKKDAKGKDLDCDNKRDCALHLHSVTSAHNSGRVFSSSAPGFVMGVGNVGSSLKPYEEGDTFLSTDSGLSWTMVDFGSNLYEFGDQGNLLVMADDQEPTSVAQYSFDHGKTWKELDLGVTLRVRTLTTIPDSTSLKILLLGSTSKKSSKDGQGQYVIVQMDFSAVGKRKCGKDDFERWFARAPDGQADCLMGHKDYYRRRKPDADCVVAEEFRDPVGREEDCECTDQDYECDFNFGPDPNGGDCIPAGPELVPQGECKSDSDTFMGSSGYRKIPGNTCVAKGTPKDAKVRKSCSEASAAPGQISHQRFEFPALVLEQAYFGHSHTLLVLLSDNTIWQSSNEGFTWTQVAPGETFLSMIMHPHFRDRCYLIGKGRKVHWTDDAGDNWQTLDAPEDPNALSLPLLAFHPTRPSWLIWTGSQDCTTGTAKNCRAIAHYTTDDGYSWHKLDSYVRTCAWLRNEHFKVDERSIICESYKEKKGSQRSLSGTIIGNPLQLVAGSNYYKNKKTLFPDGLIGFATFEEFLVVARYSRKGTLDLLVSLDGQHFAPARYPPELQLENQAYTILESVTNSIFLHVTTNAGPDTAWGDLFKSNSNGTNFALSQEYVNRNSEGFVDFEKMLGLEGIALINVVSNWDEAIITGDKKLQSRITHNDGGRWDSLSPPARDSLGRAYECSSTACALHLHGYTERVDPRATFSSPTAIGLMVAVGNVGKSLAPYVDSDTFLTRNGGFSWEEVHKDAHMWEFGDQGSILVLVNDEGPTDHVTYTLDEGMTWQEYNFGEKLRIRSIFTVPQDTSRKFILFGYSPQKQDHSAAVHLDFSKLTNRKCNLDLSDPDNDDFEVWSPSEERQEKCLFGKQTMYHRRIRDRSCYIGEELKPLKEEKICECSEDDFECEFNHVRNDRGECVLVDGAKPLASEEMCSWDDTYWYERTAYRKSPHSKCEGGQRLDHGTRHLCSHRRGHGFFYWTSVIIAPFFAAGLFAIWWTQKQTGARHGRIHLPDPSDFQGSDSPVRQAAGVLLSVPWFLVGIFNAARARIANRLPRSRRANGYRSLSLEDDAELLREDDY